MNDPQKEAREIAARHGIRAYETPAETAKQEPGCECRARKALDGIVPMIQKRADELGELGSRAYTEETRYRNYGACNGMHNLANEIGSLIVSPAISDPCPCEQLREEAVALGEQLEFDRTALADAITGIKKAFDSRFWLTEGRGSYEWDDDRYREEFCEAYREISRAIEPLKGIAANWSGCPRKAEDVAKARIDLRAERDRLRTECDELHTFKTASFLGAANMGKALSDAIDNEEKLESELAAALSLLEEAREALKPFAQSSIDEPLFRRAVAVHAKIEAAGKPEVKP